MNAFYNVFSCLPGCSYLSLCVCVRIIAARMITNNYVTNDSRTANFLNFSSCLLRDVVTSCSLRVLEYPVSLAITFMRAVNKYNVHSCGRIYNWWSVHVWYTNTLITFFKQVHSHQRPPFRLFHCWTSARIHDRQQDLTHPDPIAQHTLPIVHTYVLLAFVVTCTYTRICRESQNAYVRTHNNRSLHIHVAFWTHCYTYNTK